MIAALSRFRVANGMEADVARAFRDRPHRVESAPGFLGLETFVDRTEPDTFYLFTRWSDLESFERWHRSEEHRAAHDRIPRGLKLDPKATRVFRLDRLEGVGGMIETVFDSGLLLSDYLERTRAVHFMRLDRDGTIRSCNGAARLHLAQDEAADLSGASIRAYMPEADGERLLKLIAQEARVERPELFNFCAPKCIPYTLACWIAVQPDGVTLLGEPTFEENLRAQHDLMAMNQELADLTRQRARETVAARDALREAERVSSDKNHFLAVLAHELKQPVGAAMAALGVLRMAAADARLEGPRNVLERQLLQMSRLVNDLVEAAQVARGTLEIRVEPVDFAALVREHATLFLPVANAHGKRFTAAIPERPAPMRGDVNRLQQIVSNLLGNADKYTPPGGEIRLSLDVSARDATLTIADTGIGIPADRIDAIFGLFERATSTVGGLGIGLAVVHGLVEAHGGTIEARSEGPGTGSQFVVRLPLAA